MHKEYTLKPKQEAIRRIARVYGCGYKAEAALKALLEESKMEELKSCPFCGSKDLHISAQEAQEGGDVLFVHCKNCDACGPAFDATPEGSEEAIDAWNKRSDK